MSLILIIDGYNVIRQSPELRDYEREDPAKGREAFLAKLKAYQRLKQHQITVVFDGWADGLLNESREKVAGICVRFSRRGEKADEVIKRLAVHHKEKAIVVTTDRELGTACSRAGSDVITAQEFEERLEMAAYLDLKDLDAAEQEFDSSSGKGTRKRGPSKRPPKAERKRHRALKKL